MIIFLITLMSFYFLLSALYIFVHALAGHFFNPKKYKNDKSPKALILIPAYKEDNVIVSVAKKALSQKYNGEFDVVVIADKLKENTIRNLKKLPIKLIEVSFEKSTKSKALNLAMSKLNDDYNFVIILDADNVMEENAIKLFSDYFVNNVDIVQGKRTASNLNSNFSYLDGISEEVNNHIYCAGSNALGFSSRLVGSGMAFNYKLFKEVMLEIDVIGGFDKALELKMISKNKKIVYDPNIITYDEKVENAEVFGNQRSRWLSAQYEFFFKNIKNGINQLLKGNFDYVIKLYQFILPPRLLFPLITFIGSLITYITFNQLFYTWLSSFLLVVISYTISIPLNKFNYRMFLVFGSLLEAMWQTIKAIFKMKKASKEFIHTPHKGLEIDDE
jgi:cellulose synthase/poly-beta-1,6-N-acetylglucosamine synthase-like glycosyltransferase